MRPNSGLGYSQMYIVGCFLQVYLPARQEQEGMERRRRETVHGSI
jgi:hypothetical protein